MAQRESQTSKSLLSDICRVQFGRELSAEGDADALTEAGRALNAALNAHLKRHPEYNLSRQALLYWTRGQSTPKLAESFRFLNSYLEECVDCNNLPDDRKRLYVLLQNRLTSSLINASERSGSRIGRGNAVNAVIKSPGRGGISIRNNISKREFFELKSAVIGVYHSYRIRLSENLSNPIARETLEIFDQDGEIRFRHWCKFDGGDPTFFDGVLTLFGNIIWLVGHSLRDQERLRIMNFRYTRSKSFGNKKFHWGILLSDLSKASHEPAAARIFLVRIDDDEYATGSSAIRENPVRFMSVEEIPDKELAKYISRFVDNKVTAHSNLLSPDPLVDGQGNSLSDMVLQVNQETVEWFAATIKS